MTERMRPKKIIPLIGIALIWGSYYVASQQAVKGMSVFTTGIFIRFVTMILLLLIMGKRGELKSLFKVKGVWPKMLMIGVLGFLLDLTAFIGLSLSSVGSGTALLKCDILFVNLITAIIYKERLRLKEWACVLVMLVGVFMVMNVDFKHFSLDKGSIFFLLSALFVSINAFVIKSVQLDKTNPQSDDNVAFYNNFVTMVLFTITAAVMGKLPELGRLASDRSLFIAALLAGLGQTGIYIVYYYDLRHFPVWIVKTSLLLMPIVASVISFVIFGEKFTVEGMIGMAIVLLGGLGLLLADAEKIKNGDLLNGY